MGGFAHNEFELRLAGWLPVDEASPLTTHGARNGKPVRILCNIDNVGRAHFVAAGSWDAARSGWNIVAGFDKGGFWSSVDWWMPINVYDELLEAGG
jgi:hypothetical protein